MPSLEITNFYYLKHVIEAIYKKIQCLASFYSLCDPGFDNHY